MKTRWLINLALLLAVTLLVMLIRNAVDTARSVQTLTDLNAADLYQIRISRQGEPTILLGQDLLGWRMQAPMQVDADGPKINKLLAVLETPVHRSFPRESAALEQLELSPPKLALRLDTLDLAFGGIDPLTKRRYVGADGLVHLIDDRFFHLLIAPPIDYVSLKLLPRGFVPAFGRLGGVPLAAETLDTLAALVAERVEPIVGAASGSLAELKSGDGTTLRFRVSEDRRRWAQPDQGLLYVLTDAPDLTQDSDALDNTPPEPARSQTQPAVAPFMDREAIIDPNLGLGLGPMPESGADPFGSVPTERVPYSVPVDPDSIIPGDIPLGKPPVVRLRPDGSEEPMFIEPRSSPQRTPDNGVRPYGFGQDPFAPDPSTTPEYRPDGLR